MREQHTLTYWLGFLGVSGIRGAANGAVYQVSSTVSGVPISWSGTVYIVVAVVGLIIFACWDCGVTDGTA